MAKKKKKNKIRLSRQQGITIILSIISIAVIICVVLLISERPEAKQDKKIKTLSLVNNDVETFVLDGLKFVTNDNNGQMKILITNINDKKVDINKVIIKITNKEDMVDNYLINQNQSLNTDNTTSITLAYDINNIKTISFELAD